MYFNAMYFSVQLLLSKHRTFLPVLEGMYGASYCIIVTWWRTPGEIEAESLGPDLP